MGVGNLLVLCQVTAFLVSFLASFFIFIPLSVNLREFNGHCLLGASGKWSENQSALPYELTGITWGASSDCGFNVFMGVIVMIFSIFYIVWESIFLFKNTDSTWLDAFVTCIVCMVVCLLLFTSSLVLSVGYNKWCLMLIEPPSPVKRCEDTEMMTFIADSRIYTKNLYSEFNMAQFGSWLCWICWVVLSVLAIVKVYRYHRQEAFMLSMNRERQRLLQRVGHKEPLIT